MDEAGTSSTLTFDAFGGVLDNTLPAEMQTALAGQGVLADADTGLIHQGGGRFYDPTLGRPLQPNPFGGLPTVPQSLNRYGATSLGAPGVAEQISGGGNIFTNWAAWTSLVANVGLEVTGRRVVAESGHLVLEGSLSSIVEALDIGQGKFALGNIKVERTTLGGVAVARSTVGNVGKVTYLGEGQFSLSRSGQIVDVNSVKKTTFRKGLLLSEAKALRTISSVGLTGVIDTGFELYEFGTGTGQWGNPYLTTGQKTFQTTLVIGSDLALAGTLAFYGVAWQVAIPVTLTWALIADPVFSTFPLTAPAYQEERNLQPLP